MSESNFVKQIGSIGAGQMAKALAGGIAFSNGDARFLISDPNEDANRSFVAKVGESRVEIADSNHDVFRRCQTVFLAVKPQYFAEALKEIQFERSQKTLVVSVIAGVTISRITELLGTDRVIRVMPNTPCLVGQGACGMSAAESVAESDINLVESFLAPVGLVVRVQEVLLDSVTGLSGSGPAYVFAFMESLIAGAIQTGMPADIAKQLAIQTVYGAASLVKESGDPISVLRERVTSPGGTTLAGLKSLQENGFQETVMSAVRAATERSRELGRG